MLSQQAFNGGALPGNEALGNVRYNFSNSLYNSSTNNFNENYPCSYEISHDDYYFDRPSLYGNDSSTNNSGACSNSKAATNHSDNSSTYANDRTTLPDSTPESLYPTTSTNTELSLKKGGARPQNKECNILLKTNSEITTTSPTMSYESQNNPKVSKDCYEKNNKSKGSPDKYQKNIERTSYPLAYYSTAHPTHPNSTLSFLNHPPSYYSPYNDNCNYSQQPSIYYPEDMHSKIIPSYLSPSQPYNFSSPYASNPHDFFPDQLHHLQQQHHHQQLQHHILQQGNFFFHPPPLLSHLDPSLTSHKLNKCHEKMNKSPVIFPWMKKVHSKTSGI